MFLQDSLAVGSNGSMNKSLAKPNNKIAPDSETPSVGFGSPNKSSGSPSKSSSPNKLTVGGGWPTGKITSTEEDEEENKSDELTDCLCAACYKRYGHYNLDAIC